MKPLLLLDVDGVLNPYTRLQRAPDCKGRIKSVTEFSLDPPPLGANPFLYDDFSLHLLHPLGAPMPVALSKQMGADLTALTDVLDIGYATTWETDVEQVAEVIGLPYDGTEVIMWPQRPFSSPKSPKDPWYQSARIQMSGGSWKTPFVVDYMLRHHPLQPWLWVDDDVRKVDAAYVDTAYRVHFDRAPGGFNVSAIHLAGAKPGGTAVPYRVNPNRGLTTEDVARIRQWAKDSA